MRDPQHYGPWALVTGASDGIGEAMARRAAADGLNVVLAARREDKLRALAQNIERDNNVQTRVVAADLSTPQGLEALIAAVDTVDIGLAVLAAGFATTKPFTASAVSDELDMVALNITAVTQLSHVLARRMTARGRGGIILFGSILGWQGVPGEANYAATKAYAQTLAEGLHGELKPLGVDVLCVAPGPVHTGFAARAGLSMKSATTPAVVTDAAWSGLGRRVTVVPGARATFLTLSLSPLPRRMRSMILRRAMESMRP
jgi:short-subunit dehydrogenase